MTDLKGSGEAAVNIMLPLTLFNMIVWWCDIESLVWYDICRMHSNGNLQYFLKILHKRGK